MEAPSWTARSKEQRADSGEYAARGDFSSVLERRNWPRRSLALRAAAGASHGAGEGHGDPAGPASDSACAGGTSSWTRHRLSIYRGVVDEQGFRFQKINSRNKKK